MKYIIKESKIDMLMTDYLDTWVGSRKIIEFDRFIVLEDPYGEPENDVDMEYDGEDGRLWVRQELFDTLVDLFGKEEIETLNFIGKYFEYKFGVQVIKVE
jgi:hypothetical protein